MIAGAVFQPHVSPVVAEMRCSCADVGKRARCRRYQRFSDNRPAIINDSAAFFAPGIRQCAIERERPRDATAIHTDSRFCVPEL